jgi:uncharacterized protein YjbI with pentapeptide repeats
MASDDHVSLLKQGVDAWNEWRPRNLLIRADLNEANLRGADLSGADLRGANLQEAALSQADLRGADLREAALSGADLRGADLSWADLNQAHLRRADLDRANLSGANLIWAHLSGANLNEANLSGADLSGADLSWANLSRADLSRAYLNGAIFYETNLGNINFEKAIGLDTCRHFGPSIIDFRTLSLSKNLPVSFLRGCGLPDVLIEYLPSLRGDAFRFYSCFISYSSKDQLFAERLHADLQNAGVRCWFAPHDLPIGAKIWDAIDEAIKLRDKILVILSAASIGSDWVEDEVSKAYAEERDCKTTVLFPVRIDDIVMTTPEPWARKLRDQRHIGDFREWETPAQYSKSLERLLRDLKATQQGISQKQTLCAEPGCSYRTASIPGRS